MQPPKYSGDKNFEALLSSLDIERTIDDIKALVLGVVAALEMVPPSQLMAVILEKGTKDEIQFKNEDEAMQFYNNVMGLWNEMAAVCNAEKSFKLRKINPNISKPDILWKEVSRLFFS